MSYRTIAICNADQALSARVSSAIAQEQKAASIPPNPSPVLGTIMWSVASASDVEAAYASALAAGAPEPGADEAVITDQMILSAVQAADVTPPPTP